MKRNKGITLIALVITIKINRTRGITRYRSLGYLEFTLPLSIDR